LSGGRGAKAIFYLDGGVMSGRGSMFFSLPDAVPGIPGASAFEDSYGQVITLALPPGRHEIDAWQITNGTGMRIFPKEKPAPLVFHVGAGEIKYLGNLHANLQAGKNLFGKSIVGDGYPEVRDLRERDIRMFEVKYPQFKGKVVADILGLGPWIAGLGTRQQIDPPLPAPGIPAQK
jgi:hypothetical protein